MQDWCKKAYAWGTRGIQSEGREGSLTSKPSVHVIFDTEGYHGCRRTGMPSTLMLFERIYGLLHVNVAIAFSIQKYCIIQSV